MEPLTFECPYCSGFIQAGVDNILEHGFHCTRCKNEIKPHQVFDGEKYSFPDTMAQWIAEAFVNYYRVWMKDAAHFQETGTRSNHLADLSMKFLFEGFRRASLFIGDNLAEMGIDEIQNIFKAGNEPLSSVERVMREGRDSGEDG